VNQKARLGGGGVRLPLRGRAPADRRTQNTEDVTIGAAGIGHTALTEQLECADQIFLRINLLVLLVVAFLPFPTCLVADALGNNESERPACTSVPQSPSWCRSER
jgi:hypothetical protein